jgi:transcriptional regulator of acetoin/glycerol metabolism
MCSGGLIGIGHLPEELTAHCKSAGAGSDIRSAHDLLDTQSIHAALERNHYNRLAAARELGVHKTTLFRRMKKLEISLPVRDGRSRQKQIQ